MSSTDSRPSEVYFPDGCEQLDSLQKKILLLMGVSVIDQFIEIEPPHINFLIKHPQLPPPPLLGECLLSQPIMSLLMEFNDGIREGHGERTMRYLAQHEFLFTERQKDQLIWSRTVNTHGKSGKKMRGVITKVAIIL